MAQNSVHLSYQLTHIRVHDVLDNSCELSITPDFFILKSQKRLTSLISKRTNRNVHRKIKVRLHEEVVDRLLTWACGGNNETKPCFIAAPMTTSWLCTIHNILIMMESNAVTLVREVTDNNVFIMRGLFSVQGYVVSLNVCKPYDHRPQVKTRYKNGRRTKRKSSAAWSCFDSCVVVKTETLPEWKKEIGAWITMVTGKTVPSVDLTLVCCSKGLHKYDVLLKLFLDNNLFIVYIYI